MKHVSVNIQETIKEVFPEVLEKDLQDNEIICPTCKGLGMVPTDRPYGLVKENKGTAQRIQFPYHRNSFTFCHDCYNGIVKLCEYCGRQLSPSNAGECNCEKYKEKEKEKIKKKRRELIKSATEIQAEEAEMLYCEENERYYDGVESFIDETKEKHGKTNFSEWKDNLPKVLWVCSSESIELDAESIADSATSELHEDAYDNIDSEDMQELQNMLDEWCRKQFGTKTYYPDYKKYVRVSKNWFSDCDVATE